MSTRCHIATHLFDVQPSRRILISYSLDLVTGCAYSQCSEATYIVGLFCFCHFQHAGWCNAIVLYHFVFRFICWCTWHCHILKMQPSAASVFVFSLASFYITLTSTTCSVLHDNTSNQFFTRGDKEFIVIYLAAANLMFPRASASLQLHNNIFENIKGVRYKMRHPTTANWRKKNKAYEILFMLWVIWRPSQMSYLCFWIFYGSNFP